MKNALSDKPALTVKEVSALMGLSRQTVTRIFEDEPGTIILPAVKALHKRGQRSIRIPRAVYERVVHRLSVK